MKRLSNASIAVIRTGLLQERTGSRIKADYSISLIKTWEPERSLAWRPNQYVYRTYSSFTALLSNLETLGRMWHYYRRATLISQTAKKNVTYLSCCLHRFQLAPIHIHRTGYWKRKKQDSRFNSYAQTARPKNYSTEVRSTFYEFLAEALKFTYSIQSMQRCCI